LIDQNYCPGNKNCPGQVRQIYCLYTLSFHQIMKVRLT
jgi:hypothetical protein